MFFWVSKVLDSFPFHIYPSWTGNNWKWAFFLVINLFNIPSNIYIVFLLVLLLNEQLCYLFIINNLALQFSKEGSFWISPEERRQDFCQSDDSCRTSLLSRKIRFLWIYRSGWSRRSRRKSGSRSTTRDRGRSRQTSEASGWRSNIGIEVECRRPELEFCKGNVWIDKNVVTIRFQSILRRNKKTV